MPILEGPPETSEGAIQRLQRYPQTAGPPWNDLQTLVDLQMEEAGIPVARKPSRKHTRGFDALSQKIDDALRED